MPYKYDENGVERSHRGAAIARSLDYRRVYDGTQDVTEHGLRRKDLKKNKSGKIASRKKISAGKKRMRELKNKGKWMPPY